MQPLWRQLRNARWTIFDQVLSSITNFVVSWAAVRFGTAAEVGGFAVAMTGFALALGVSRNMISEPDLLRVGWARGGPDVVGDRKVSVADSVALIGLVSACMLAATGILFLDGYGPWLWISIGLPGLLLQDAYRYRFIARGLPQRAAVSDGAWLLLFAGSLALISGLASLTVSAVVLAWSVTGAVVGVAAYWPEGWRFWEGVRPLLAERRGHAYAAEWLVSSGGAQVTNLGIASVGGLSMAGVLRAGATVFQPINPLMAMVQLIVLPAAARRLEDPRRVRRLLLGSYSVPALAAVGVVVGLEIWPDIGVWVFGSGWLSARSVVVPLGVAIGASAFAQAAVIGLRVLGATREPLRGRVWHLAIRASVLLGAAIFGTAEFVALLQALVAIAAALAWWRSFMKFDPRPGMGLLPEPAARSAG